MLQSSSRHTTFVLMTAGVFSWNVEKLFSELKLKTDLFIYAAADWKTAERNIVVFTDAWHRVATTITTKTCFHQDRSEHDAYLLYILLTQNILYFGPSRSMYKKCVGPRYTRLPVHVNKAKCIHVPSLSRNVLVLACLGSLVCYISKREIF